MEKLHLLKKTCNFPKLQAKLEEQRLIKESLN